MRYLIFQFIRLLPAASMAGFALVLGGCATLMSSVTAGLAEDLSVAILDNPDIEMVRDGAPAYLILIDGLLAQSPNNPTLLRQAALLNSAYATAFVTDEVRAQTLQVKALDLAERAVCAGVRDGCDVRRRSFDDYQGWLAARGLKDVPMIYQLGSTWAGWIQANSEDYGAIAELARVKALMQRVIELNENYEYGGAHLYMGVFETLLPPALGGRPEVGRTHFERAVELSSGDQMLTKVMFAERYARLVFDRELHDQLLNEVLEADPNVAGLTLINVVARQQAADLLDTADEYF